MRIIFGSCPAPTTSQRNSSSCLLPRIRRATTSRATPAFSYLTASAVIAAVGLVGRLFMTGTSARRAGRCLRSSFCARRTDGGVRHPGREVVARDLGLPSDATLSVTLHEGLEGGHLLDRDGATVGVLVLGLSDIDWGRILAVPQTVTEHPNLDAEPGGFSLQGRVTGRGAPVELSSFWLGLNRGFGRDGDGRGF